MKKKKTRKPKQERAKRTRERLLNAGKRLFSEYSFHDIHAGHIAHEAKTSVGSFYAYFNDKRELFIAIIEEYVENAITRAIPTLDCWFSEDQRLDLEDIIEQLLRSSFDLHKEAAPLLKEYIRMSLYDEEFKKHLDKIDIRIRGLLETVLKKFNSSIDNRQAKDLAYILFHASEGVIHQTMFNPEEIDEEKAIGILTKLFIHCIENELPNK